MSGKSLVIVLIFFAFIFMGQSQISNDSAFSLPKGAQWFRGNTHTHLGFSFTNNNKDALMIARWYEEAGYDFLLISEHNNPIIKREASYHDEASALPDFIMLCGLELSNSIHLTALGIDNYIGDETSLGDGVKKTIANGGVPILNHPQDPVVTAKSFLATEGLNHLEVFNGTRPDDTPATEMLWDSILSFPSGRLVYAVASDDNHYKKADIGKGWIMVKSSELTRAAIEENIKNGNFYASTGITLNTYHATKRFITIDSQNGDTITFIGKDGFILSKVSGKKATYEIKGDELYVRAKVTNTESKAAWTQPVFVK
jgi:hypothetical protein